MDAFSLLQKNSDVAIGAAGGVILGPIINSKLEQMLSFGSYSSAIIPIAVAYLTLFTVGKTHSGMAVPFAAVELAYGLSEIIPAGSISI